MLGLKMVYLLGLMPGWSRRVSCRIAISVYRVILLEKRVAALCWFKFLDEATVRLGY